MRELAGVYHRGGAKLLLYRVLKELGMPARYAWSAQRMLEELGAAKTKRKLTLLIDDLHLWRKPDFLVLEELAKLTFVRIVAAAEKLPKGRFRWIFDERLWLQPLNMSDTLKLAKLAGRKPTPGVFYESQGIPLAIITGRGGLAITRRVDLLPMKYVPALAYLLLGLRYLALGAGDRGFYIVVGILGFTALSLNSANKS